MIDGYGLFDWIFNGLAVDKDFVEDNDPIIVIANILKRNNIDLLRKGLNSLKYSADEVKAISFLVALLKLDVETAVTLKKIQQSSGVTDEQIKKFATKNGVKSNLIDAFQKFRLSVSGPEAMEITGLKPGPELGSAIQKIETDNFKKLL
jgi:hypothetical protein